jgi:hypothetical protein
MLSCVETFIYVHIIVTNNNHIEVHSCHYPSVRIRFNRTQRRRSGECTRIWQSLPRIELDWPVCVGLRDTLTENFVLDFSPTSPLCDTILKYTTCLSTGHWASRCLYVVHRLPAMGGQCTSIWYLYHITTTGCGLRLSDASGLILMLLAVSEQSKPF